MGIYDSAGRELIWDDEADNYVPVPVETAFDATVWDTIDKSRKAPVSELQEVITGAHHSSADFGGDEQLLPWHCICESQLAEAGA